MKKTFVLLLMTVMLKTVVMAQFSSVLLRVDGLTCSACSYSTQQSILQLDFVDEVKMDLNSHIATITFKPSKNISIHQIAKKVYAAGFSVGSMMAIFNFNSTEISDNTCFDYEGNAYHFEKLTDKQTLNGIKKIKFIGERYMNRSDFKEWKKSIKKNVCNKPDNFSGQEYNVILMQ